MNPVLIALSARGLDARGALMISYMAEVQPRIMPMARL